MKGEREHRKWVKRMHKVWDDGAVLIILFTTTYVFLWGVRMRRGD